MFTTFAKCFLFCLIGHLLNNGHGKNMHHTPDNNRKRDRH